MTTIWLIISIINLSMWSVLSAPYGYNNFNTNAQAYHPVNFEAREILPYGNDGVKISHTLSTVNKEYGLMQHLIPPPVPNTPNYYSFAPVTTQLPITTQPPPRHYYTNPAINRHQYNIVPVTPRINHAVPVITTSTPAISKLNIYVPSKDSHSDLEYQNTHNLEKAYDEADDGDNDDDDGDEYPQKSYSESPSQKQNVAHGKDPRDPNIQKPQPKLPDRKDRIDFQVYGFDGPKSYKFGYDTGKGENRQFRYETRDRDGNVSGRYGYVDLTGKLNVVKYTSNADDGFRTETL